jgi:aspartate aminotransferase
MKGWIEEYKRRRDLLYSGLRSIPGIEVELPEGAFYMMPRLPVADSEEFSRWLLTEFALDHQTVMLAPGPGFYASPDKGRNEVRVAYVLKEESLRNALRVLEAALKAYR